MGFRSTKNEITTPPSLRRTLFRYVIDPVLVAFLILFTIIFTSGLLITQSIQARQASQIANIASQIDLYLTEIDNLMQVVADSINHIEAAERATSLTHIRELNPRFTALYIIDPDGIVTIESSDMPMLLGLDLSGEPFFNTREYGKTYFSDPFVSLLAGDVVVTAATPIYYDREYLGMLVAELNLSKLQEVIDQVSIEEGFSFIVDSKGTYIAHPNDTLVRERQYFSNLSYLERAKQSPIAFEILRSQPGNSLQITSISQVKQDWFVVTMQPINSVLFPLSALAVITLLALTITMLLFFMRVQRSLQDIAVPVSKLAEKAEQISQGDYAVEFEHSNPQIQEINSLEKSFTRMLTGIQNRDRYLEQRVEERTQQLEEANQDLEAFLYSVSHDLRAPLRAVIGYSDILAAEYNGDLDEEGKLYLERILAQGRRMDHLITDLLDLSRLGRKSLKIEDVDLSELAQHVFEREVENYEHGSVTELVLHPTPSVPADPQMVEIMLTNLMDNAIKFSAQTAHPKIEFGYQEDEEQSYFYLRDNGIGFDPKYAEKLFVPFQRLHDTEEFEGSGIGLAIVQRVIRSHGGQIWVESIKRKGTTFNFYL